MGARSFCLILLLLSAAVSFAQDSSPAAVQIVTYWDVGDTHSYNLEMGTKMSLEAGSSESRTSYRVIVEVLKHTDAGYLIQWTYTNAVPPEGANAFERRVVEINEGLSVRFLISDLGEYAGIENWKEISRQVNEAAADIRRDFSGRADVESSLAKVMQAFESKAEFERLAMEEIRFYHMLYGYSYFADDPLIVEGEVENPFGGKPLHANTRIELAEVDSRNNTAYLVYTRTFQPAALNRAVFEALNGYLPEGELTPEQIATLPKFDMDIEKQFIFHTASGWLLEAYSQRYAQTGDEIRTDTIYIKFLE